MTLAPTRAELNLDGRRLSYLDYGGPGQPLLALHGHLHEGRTWEHLARDLAPDWRIIPPTNAATATPTAHPATPATATSPTPPPCSTNSTPDQSSYSATPSAASTPSNSPPATHTSSAP